MQQQFNTLKISLLAGSLFFSTYGSSQTGAPDSLLLKQHIMTLADDKMEGRETGTEGEKLAYEYISTEFRKLGLLPKGELGYIQPFQFNAGSYMGPSNELKVKNKNFVAGDQFYPLGYSSNGKFKGNAVFVKNGIAAPGYNDYEGLNNLNGKVFVMESGYPEGMDPHSRMAEYADFRTRLDSAIAKGAVAVVFVNSSKDSEDPSRSYSNRITPVAIPVIFANGEAAKAIKAGGMPVSGSTEILKKEKTGHNILGYIDNNAQQTVVIGAHYDHLGYGIEGSLYRGEKKAIHNGADDNASGTAGLIELARILKASDLKSNNYLFIAFSGEEMGLLGSNHLVKHFPFPVSQVNYMINMDMIGRLKPEEPVLIINGTGTSPEWNKVLSSIHVEGLKTKTTESGVGPSDHTSFYLQNIPVLHFFSGTHNDYHKPDDDEYKINYPGQLNILAYILQVVSGLDQKGKIAFTKTNDSSNEDAPRFKVTLGVVPDYAFDQEGMRIDGVSDGKPAQKAGLHAGDIVIQIGDHKVVDMMSYMKALGKFTKGEKTKVKVKRGEEILEKDIEF